MKTYYIIAYLILFSTHKAISQCNIVVDSIKNINCFAACTGEINVHGNNGTSPYIYTLNPGAVISTNGSFNNLCAATYTVSLNDSLNCTHDTIITLTTTPEWMFVNPTNTSICLHDSAILQATGGISYNWQPGNYTDSSIKVSPIANTIYSVTATNSLGCTSSKTIMVVVNPLPSIGININPSTEVCSGDLLTLTASGALTYNWSSGIINGAPFAPFNSTTYTLIAIDSLGCSKKDSVSIVVNPLTAPPTVSLTSNPNPIITGHSNTITAVIPGTVTNYIISWYVNNILVSSSNSPNNTFVYTPTSLSDGVHAIVNLLGCYMPNNQTTTKLYPLYPLGIKDEEVKSSYYISPNPATTSFHIISKEEFSELFIYNQQMSMVKKINTLSTQNLHVDIESLSEGVYFIKTNQDDLMKLVIQR